MTLNLSVIDYVILAILIVSVVTGFCRGFVRELFSIALWALAIWASSHYSGLLAAYLQPWIAQVQLRNIIAFVALTAVLIIFGGVIISALSFLIRKSGLSGSDRILGMVFGVFRAVFVVALVIAAMNFSGFNTAEYEAQSKLYPQFKPAVIWLQGFIPKWMKHIQQFDQGSHAVALATEVKPNIALANLTRLS